MSNDGSFNLQSSLSRFLARNPNLIRIPKFAALSEKGAALTIEDFVESISDLFIHSSYTISIVGCFRAIGKSIVVKVVRKLQKFENLLGKDERIGADEEIGEDDVNVIDFYLRRKRGLRVHELACLAFVRTLNLSPSLLSCVLRYFKFAPPPFKSLQSISGTSEIVENRAVRLLEVVRVSYHFLLMDYNKVFTEQWDWSCFLELLKHMNEYQLRNGAVLDTIWCTIQILSLRISYRSAENYIGEDQSLACFQRWIAYCQDTSLEYFSYYYQDSEVEVKSCVREGVDFSQCIESYENGHTSNDELEPNRKKIRNDMSSNLELSRYPFVLTLTLGKSFEMTQMAVSQKWPVLLHGPTGSGKTALIQHLAEITKNQILFIHMDDQMDNKTLIGSYVSTERPGEFKWQHGSLTQAILNGYWVVFEDIDKAPNEVQSLLLPLLEGSSSFTTGYGEVLRVVESFRLFGTISTSKHQSNVGVEGRFFFSPLWWKVVVGTPSTADMQKIVNIWYPSLALISARLLETFQMFYFATTIRYDAIHGSGMLSGNYNRISIRDLLKWCKRIAGVYLISGTGISSITCQKIYTEAVDIFTGYLASLDNRLSAMKEIDRIWGLVSKPENVYPLNKPMVQATKSHLQVGRVTIDCLSEPGTTKFFINLRSSLHVLERIACSVKYNEPVLLVGETGTGKTTLVQNLAERLGRPLTVMNLSQQSDATDLLGGYKPTDAFSICLPIYNEFRNLFVKSVSRTVNEDKLRKCEEYVMGKKWTKLLKFCKRVADLFLNQPISGPKRKKPLDEEVLNLWKTFYAKLEIVQKQIKSPSGMSFKFVEGAFITALKNGNWILLDEVNLAPPETLQRIISVLDGESGTLCLAERGDITYLERNPQFRLFACMNPATDAGKRELPFSFRSRLTEYFVDDVLDDEDLRLFVNQYLPKKHHDTQIPIKIVEFYKEAKKKSEDKLQDGANQKPQFSLRSLARALQYLNKAEGKYGFVRAIYDGFSMFFLTLLDGQSTKIMEDMIKYYLIGGTNPSNITFADYANASQVDLTLDSFMSSYVRTKSVEQHLINLARAVYIKKYPVLLQGPTSSGKTSLVRYLATYTGHKFVRINNHEHTDLQEYLGSYVTDSQGKLIFEEGVLVKAVRYGYWIVLDELNLAPSDVLEALNRLLDDNREIFVPETQESVSAHPEFMLFATQNPPMLYGGRKVLSRAFRNRFLEIHVDEIPDDELSDILKKRCLIPTSRAKKMVEIMKDLQLHRQSSKAFAGKHGFITPRDLFRWASRYRKFEKTCKSSSNDLPFQDLAKEGYLLLAERLRDEYEKSVVQETLERRLRVNLAIDELYDDETSQTEQERIQNIVWTKSMKRLYYLVKRCYEMKEPVLLIGETGGGKTTVCQLLSEAMGRKLHILNCHQYTETSDFIGGFHPVRDRSRLFLEFKSHIEDVKQSKVFLCASQDHVLSTDIAQASSTINQLNDFEKNAASNPCLNKQDIDAFVLLKKKIVLLFQDWQSIFLWQNGPLVQAMEAGDFFLIDEISLADDSVLERLNSVLEPERKLSLAEKGGSVLEEIIAHKDFFVLATMNPGGDYGKKELSPALRNRFTEIWVSSVTDADDLGHICLRKFKKPELSQFADYIVKFWQWFNQLQTGRMLTIRDLLSWVSFINETEESLGPVHAFVHGAFLVILDGLSLGTGLSKSDAKMIRENAVNFIHEELKNSGSGSIDSHLLKLENYGWGEIMEFTDDMSHNDDKRFGINPFYIRKNVGNLCKREGFEFLAPTTRKNALRVLRALQLSKPVLLEGSPGVGKTSLVVALAEYSGHEVVRINLSEQTDMMDLLGSDLPVEGDNGMEFSWSDGILLQALKKGNWVLLDELNLAPQSVLEGLNAILDHRAEVYIPELGERFKCPPSFKVFACQNPSSQGGGRKGLPKSFLNRFTKVYVDELSEEDYNFICLSRFPSLPSELISNLICFNNRLFEDTMVTRKYGQDGSPWEFNLRDVIRSCQIVEGAPEASKADSFLNIVYLQRMRTATDREEIVKLYEEVFGSKPLINVHPNLDVSSQKLTIGTASIDRNHLLPQKISKNQLHMLPGFHHSLEAIAQCVQHKWLCILVGPYSSGKTSLIHTLSLLTGNSLVELNLSSGTDVSELLGCFEQYNSYRIFRDLVCQVERYIKEYFAKLSTEDLGSDRMSLFAKWLASLAAGNYSVDMSISRNSNDGLLVSIGDLIEIINLLIGHVEKFENLSVSWMFSDVTRTLETALDLEKKLKTEQEKNLKTEQMSKFKWMTGDLIKAIECGDWVVLDNANLCNPTVLDRINSLVEQDGSITVNECGLVDGKPVRLVPHSNFRMFLTMDPKHGEISRAMRNRGVEVFMMQPNWLVEEESHDSKNIEINDVRKFLLLSDIPLKKLILAMSEAHMHAKNMGSSLGVHITLLELSRWVQLFQQLITNGNQPEWSLHSSYEYTYLSSLGENEGRDIIEKAKVSWLSYTDWYVSNDLLEYSLSLPGGWPSSHSIRDFVCYPKETYIRQNCAYLEHLGYQFGAYKLSSLQNGVKFRDMKPSLLPKNLVHSQLFPNVTYKDKLPEFDEALVNQMLNFASNWTLEQATEVDYSLYLQYFNWCDVEMFPYCDFFRSLLKILDKERNHPIWIHSFKFSTDSKPLQLVRRTYRQWNTEDNKHANDSEEFREVLSLLRCLEEKVLGLFSDSHKYIYVYLSLLENHILFWKSYTASKFDQSSIIWHWLMKEALRFKTMFPKEVESLTNIKKIPKCDIYYYTPKLWVHAGHPFLPSSAEIYDKMLQLLSFCEETWPNGKYQILCDNAADLKVVLSANTELRQLAVQAVCMLWCTMMNCDQDTSNSSFQLEDIYQGLRLRVEHEKENLKMISLSRENSNNKCCTVSSDILCLKSGFDSWMQTLPLFDQRSFLMDINLLKELSTCVLLDSKEVYQALLSRSDFIQHNLDYSISYSTRPPTNFAPHQAILWVLNAWTSVDSANTKLACLLNEFWFNWHTSLWNSSSKIAEKLSLSGGNGSCHLIHLTSTVILDKILEGAVQIKDYDMQFVKLRTVSKILWKDIPLKKNLADTLLSVASNLLKQIILVHRKFFDEDTFQKIKVALSQLTENDASTCYLTEMILNIKSLLSKSRHRILRSVMVPVIDALFEELYSKNHSFDPFKLASAWVHIGTLRFSLLLNPNGPDPAMKYSFKHFIISEKISSLELETKVRKECAQLAGRSSTRDNAQGRVSLLQNLEKEQRRLQSKIVFRPESSKYKTMRKECSEFNHLVSNCMKFVKELKSSACTQSSIDKANSWQITASSFIDKLSKDYAQYKDLIQPLQVAIYEMKLGLSLAVSGAKEKIYLKKVDEENSERIVVPIYNLMRFPRELTHEFTPDYVDSLPVSCISHTSRISQFIDANFLEKLATVSIEAGFDKALQAKLHHIILIGAAHYACTSLLVDKTIFMLLDEILGHFVTLWMEMKSQAKVKEDGEFEYFKFKPRSIVLEDIVDANYMSDADEALEFGSDELLMEREFTSMKPLAKEDNDMEEEWSMIPEYVLKSLVHIHSLLFGSNKLVEQTQPSVRLTEDRLCCFMDSYALGAKIIQDFQALSTATLDENLKQEQLFRVCLEYDQMVAPTSQLTRAYNVYKDSNASVISKMVKPLIIVQEKVESLLMELPEHPALEKVIDITKTLLEFPLSTPVSKALLGLQLLVSRVQSLKENFSISLIDLVCPIHSLVSSWQKLELDSWPVLLDEVEHQYTSNAEKLWFPLRAILHRNLSGDGEMDTIQSMEDFIQTSSVGEFMRRLQLLHAFHGQLNRGIYLHAYSSESLHVKENLNILYNVVGYYFQFVPLILEHIESGRKEIEKELRECLKLYNWERSTVESFRRTRQKIWKHVKKYNEILQQPVMIILNQGRVQRSETPPSWLEKKISDENNMDVVQFPLDIEQLNNAKRFLWFEKWKMIAESTFKSTLLTNSIPENCMTAWKESWNSFEKISAHAAEFAHLWQHEKNNHKKKRVFRGLLKTLEQCGLSKSKTMFSELENKGSHFSSMFLQPSYTVENMLQSNKCILTWEAAEKIYFKNLGMVQQLRQVRLNFNKTLILDQVEQAVSFIDHLMIIQQEQRFAAYGVAEQLQNLRCQFNNIGGREMGDKFFLSPNQHTIIKFMWQQKNLFDNLLAMSKDTQLFLQNIEKGHKNSCVVKAEVDIVSVILEKFIPVFLQSKASLDKYLIDSDKIVTISVKCVPLVVSQQMEQLLALNFQVIQNFGEDINTLRMQKESMSAVRESVLDRLENLVIKGKTVFAKFNSEIEENLKSYSEEQTSTAAIEEINKLLTSVFKKLDFVWDDQIVLKESSAQHITALKELFEFHMKNMSLDHLYNALKKAILSVSNLNNCMMTQINMHLGSLHSSLDLLLQFAENLLFEFLDAHKTIAEITHVLAHMFILLFSKGFGDTEEADDECDVSKDASGTGMGEGEGVKDVSEQIEDEEQLLGTADKRDEKDKSEKLPDDKDKGVEMEEDFEGDTFSVSEDSGDDEKEEEEEDEDVNIESKMGETGDDKQVVDEKLWDKNEDDEPEKSNAEKYESGSSIKESETSDKELRAKEDDDPSLDELGEAENDKDGKDDDTNISEEENELDDMKLDKKNAFEDPTGIELSDHEKDLEDDAMEEAQEEFQEVNGDDVGEEMNDEGDGIDEEMKGDENNIPNDDDSENIDTGEGKDSTTMEVESKKENIVPEKIEPSDNLTPNSESMEPANNSYSADKAEPEMRWSNSSDINNNLAPAINSEFENAPKMEMSILNSGDNSKLSSDNQPKPQNQESDSPSVSNFKSNPYRDIGNAMEEWKERVKVSDKLENNQPESLLDETIDENTDEYQYVSEEEKSTSQALGSATSDQVNDKVESKQETETDFGDEVRNKEEIDKMDIIEENSETKHLMSNHNVPIKEKTNDKILNTGVDDDEIMVEREPDRPENGLGDAVTFKNSYMNERDIMPMDDDILNDDSNILKRVEVEELSDDAKRKAMADWKRYELSTAKISQELAEHLRLVMEPTLASKLQGDYRTGKRINMKKVIPYIASHYRKDKIWLRRTKPNKRDYQVVIAIDDSRSMSENNCGTAAVESLVTVCRAMSQLEVGQFAVASFGQKGNIKLLHEFDQPFTGEAGVKMLSSLSFKQDNTIADEPVVDLLKHLNIMLDNAVMKARMPSGCNPLNQLILIIADGRFHEKENLKRCIRNALNRKRMIAFILLDNGDESVMDLKTASYEGNKLSVTKYLDSFPFPYYIILKNMEALPRALGDLLRQWFELMQNSSE